MRIITGSARGAILTTLDGDATRPTPAKVKEAVFSSIQFDIEGRRVLDLFAGSGQMGLEALSRGRGKGHFRGQLPRSGVRYTANAQKTHLYQKANVLCMDWRQYIRSAAGRNKFDIVFLDPPYGLQILPQVTAELYDAGLLADGAILVCEDERLGLADDVMVEARYQKIKDARYGRVSITYLTPLAQEEE